MSVVQTAASCTSSVPVLLWWLVVHRMHHMMNPDSAQLINVCAVQYNLIQTEAHVNCRAQLQASGWVLVMLITCLQMCLLVCHDTPT